MKLFIPFLISALASLTSCHSIATKAGAKTNPAGRPAKVSPFAKKGTGELKKGMTRKEVRSELGKPSYQYAMLEEETWVYENGNLVVDKAKETALNLVPVVGPATSLIIDLRPTTQEAKAEVVFNSDGKVRSFNRVD